VAEYKSVVSWRRDGAVFTDNRYSRGHKWLFDAGLEVPASASGKLAMTRVTLHPDVRFAGDKRPTEDEVLALHHEAHDRCFIANSVRTVVRCEPIWDVHGDRA
jgi:organic hydroperoxide reductase OsmC/OhrA